jgi:hypothetical protein
MDSNGWEQTIHSFADNSPPSIAADGNIRPRSANIGMKNADHGTLQIGEDILAKCQLIAVDAGKPLGSWGAWHCWHAFRQYLVMNGGLAWHSFRRAQAPQQGSSLKQPGGELALAEEDGCFGVLWVFGFLCCCCCCCRGRRPMEFWKVSAKDWPLLWAREFAWGA